MICIVGLIKLFVFRFKGHTFDRYRAVIGGFLSRLISPSSSMKQTTQLQPLILGCSA